jgi:uncharacterized protein YceK
MMKILRVLLVLAVVQFLSGLGTVYSETIYTKDGEVIQAKITEKTENVIWYETTTAEIVEYIGIEVSCVEKVLNDDGSISKYSPRR